MNGDSILDQDLIIQRNSESIIMRTLRINKELHGVTMDEHCCKPFELAMRYELIEKVDCPKAEYCFKNNFCYVFIKFCPFCGDELEVE